MTAVLLSLAVLALIGFKIWMSWLDHRYTVELATRSEEEFNVAGLDKAAEVSRHAWWGNGPWRMRRLRRKLDDAAVKIARFEQEQRERKRRAQP
ncbi:hypothetical protein [Nocardioides sp.]|uniref:hypothetical protein n=1 Tax=Nocardioides sp. TaxID=35761 RepID=UPI0025F960E3|nr:hypothetical protein [Nocardioides sp.]